MQARLVEDEVTYSQTIENVVVTATAAKDVLPEDAKFVVTPIKSEDAQYEDIAARLEEKAENEEYSIAGFLAYDIYFLNNAGEKINPEDGKVKISMEYQNATAPEEEKESDAVQMDAANQLTNIDWYPATDKADEESVPGAVATSFIMGSTIQRIKKNGVEEYSQMLYNRVHDSALDLFNYPDPALSLCEKHFYSLLQPEDVTVIGGKTGTTEAAGSCLVLYSKNSSGKPYISVVLKGNSKRELYTLMTELLTNFSKE